MAAFTDRELDVMTVLWARGPSTVAEVREALDDPLAYTTVLTVLRVLEEKGFVGYKGEGRAHRYFPLVKQQAARRSALRRMTDKLFEGSTELLLTHLVAEEKLSPAELTKIREVLDRAASRRKEPK